MTQGQKLMRMLDVNRYIQIQSHPLLQKQVGLILDKY